MCVLSKEYPVVLYMSALLGHKEQAFVSWKGKTFNQVYGSIQRNFATAGPVNGDTLFLSNPVKLYRREIASANVANCNPRISSSIDLIDMPNGYLVNPSNRSPGTEGLVNTLDINYENNSTEHPGTCTGLTTGGVCQDMGTNALRRVRSSGMIRSKNNTYFTNSNQYLNSRAKTYQQNQYSHFRSGNSSAKPGTNAAIQNTYGPNASIEFCPLTSNCTTASVVYKPNNPLFAQQGGASASAQIARRKYDTITRNGLLYTESYGNQVGNALAYGTESDKYTIKDKIGFPNIRTPIISKYGTTVCATGPGSIEANEYAFRPGQ
jgi:hypothetical protein